VSRNTVTIHLVLVGKNFMTVRIITDEIAGVTRYDYFQINFVYSVKENQEYETVCIINDVFSDC
jgi:hypothetical protein